MELRRFEHAEGGIGLPSLVWACWQTAVADFNLVMCFNVRASNLVVSESYGMGLLDISYYGFCSVLRRGLNVCACECRHQSFFIA